MPFTLKQYGVIGYPLLHSQSPQYFMEKFRREGIENYDYRAYPLTDIAKLRDLLTEQESLLGLNVTIPYKQQVLPYISHLDPTAAEIRAVNTIKVYRDHQQIELWGYNTDVTGFRESLLPQLQPHTKKALVFGTGGAAKAAAYVLRELGIEFHFVSREKSGGQIIKYSDMDIFELLKHPLLINATPADSTFLAHWLRNKIAEPPGQQHIFFDLNYDEDYTPFLQLGKEWHASTKNGLDMLHKQAEASWKIWNAD